MSVLNSSLLNNPKPSTMKPVTMDVIIKFPKEYVGGIVCAKQVFEKCMQIVYAQIDISKQDPGFPGKEHIYSRITFF